MTSHSKPIIHVDNLAVDYKISRGKTWRAVRGISFDVYPGECVGFIGANGAGKSSTMKALLGFVFPAEGKVEVFGAAAGTVESRQRLGYLPEVAMYYPFMKARELLQLYGGLQGMTKEELNKKIPELLEKVGLSGKGEILLRQFSKGMQQRLGIAQAIIADPELLIFDELSSGLDPMGRHDLRTVLIDLKKQGKTIFFSSHELSEVESLCDRVIMIDKGQIVTEGSVQDIMKPLHLYEVTFNFPKERITDLNWGDSTPQFVNGVWKLEAKDPAEYAHVISSLSAAGAEILSTSSKSRSLEDYFISLINEQKNLNQPKESN